MFRFLVALAIPFLFCALIALFYRPENTYFNYLMLEGIGANFVKSRAYIRELAPFSNFVIYSLPGGLWVLLISLLGWRLYWEKIHFFYLGLLSGIGFEVIQFWGLTDGTFDPNDLLAVFIGFGVAYWCTRFWLPPAWRSSSGTWRYVLFFTVFFAAFGADVFR